MKNILFFIPLLFLIASCAKTEFKETKIAPQAAPMTAPAETASAPPISPDLTNKDLPPGHPPINAQGGPADGKTPVKVEKIAKAKNGITVEQCFQKNPKLKDAEVTIRGKVVKYSAGIMGKNWLHVRDGSGKEGSNDLVVTTEQQAKINDTVTVTGKLQYDRDIGSGYFFPAIIENANLKLE